MEEQYVEIGGRIAKLRKKLDLTQQELAEAVGYETNTAISLIEAGKRRVQLSELEGFAKVLKTSAHFLLTGQEPNVDIGVALRAEKDLDHEEIKQVVNFIDFLKKQRENDGRKD